MKFHNQIAIFFFSHFFIWAIIQQTSETNHHRFPLLQIFFFAFALFFFNFDYLIISYNFDFFLERKLEKFFHIVFDVSKRF